MSPSRVPLSTGHRLNDRRDASGGAETTLPATLKVVSWNLLRRVGASLDDVVALIEREAPDLMLMQEATSHFNDLCLRIGGHYAWAPLPGRIHGLAMWSPLPWRQSPIVRPLAGRFLDPAGLPDRRDRRRRDRQRASFARPEAQSPAAANHLEPVAAPCRRARRLQPRRSGHAAGLPRRRAAPLDPHDGRDRAAAHRSLPGPRPVVRRREGLAATAIGSSAHHGAPDERAVRGGAAGF